MCLRINGPPKNTAIPFKGSRQVGLRQLERRESQRLFHAGLPMPFLRLFHATRFTGGHDYSWKPSALPEVGDPIEKLSLPAWSGAKQGTNAIRTSFQ